MQYYASGMQRNNAKKVADIRDFRKEEGLSQTEIAKKLGISQSTVSRRERKPPQRHSDASYKLCNYAETQLSPTGDRRAVKKAFDQVWNKSDEHAAALSKLVEAFSLLCKASTKDKEESG
jgi:transcriptional regulator with XRE-family HTH domain